MSTTVYAYPKGDFLSGFSANDEEPCSYELECQRMTIRGVKYLDENQEIYRKILAVKNLTMLSPILEEMIEFMCSSEENPEPTGQTGAMLGQTLRHAIAAKRLGWESYIQTITKKEQDEQEVQN